MSKRLIRQRLRGIRPRVRFKAWPHVPETFAVSRWPLPVVEASERQPVFRSQYQMTGRQLRKYNWRLGLRPDTASGLQTYVTPKLMSMCLPALGSTRTRAIMKCAEQNKWASSRVPNLTLPPASSSPVRRPTGDLGTDPTASLSLALALQLRIPPWFPHPFT